MHRSSTIELLPDGAGDWIRTNSDTKVNRFTVYHSSPSLSLQHTSSLSIILDGLASIMNSKQEPLFSHQRVEYWFLVIIWSTSVLPLDDWLIFGGIGEFCHLDPLLAEQVLYFWATTPFGSSDWIRTSDISVNSRTLYHWATEEYWRILHITCSRELTSILV